MARRLAASVLFHSLLWQVTLSSSNSYSYGKQEMLFSEYIRSIQDSREQITVPFRCGRELRVAFCFTWTGRLNPYGALQLPTSRMRWRVARTTHTTCSVTLTTPSTPTSSISDLSFFTSIVCVDESVSPLPSARTSVLRPFRTLQHCAPPIDGPGLRPPLQFYAAGTKSHDTHRAVPRRATRLS